MNLTTKAAVRDYKGWSSNTDRDTWIDSRIEAWSQRFEKATGRTALKASKTEYFTVESNTGQSFGVKGIPVDTSATITIANDVDRSFASSSEISSDYWHMDGDTGVLVIDNWHLDTGYKVLKVTYTGGMATTASNFISSFPDVSDAIAIQVAFEYESRNRLGQGSVTGADGSVSMFDPMEIVPPLKAAIKHYKRRRFYGG